MSEKRKISVVAAVNAAWNDMKSLLFSPFDIGFYLKLALVFTLVGLVASFSGCRGNLNIPTEFFKDFSNRMEALQSNVDEDETDSESSEDSTVQTEITQEDGDGKITVTQTTTADAGNHDAVTEDADDAVADDGADVDDDDADASAVSHRTTGPLGEFAGILKTIGIPLLIGIVLLVFAVILLLYWIGCRALMMSWDILITRNRGFRFGEVWRNSAMTGNSLFRFVIGFSILLVVLFLLVVAGFVLLLMNETLRNNPACLVALLVVLTLLFIPVLFYFFLFFQSMGPILMFKHQITAWEAFPMFFQLVNRNFGKFLRFILMSIMISMAFGTVIMILGCVTCCIGFILLMIPFVGTALTLPIPVFMSYFSLEFIRQFGPEFDPWTPVAEPAEAPDAVPADAESAAVDNDTDRVKF